MHNSIKNVAKIMDAVLERPSRLKDISNKTGLSSSNTHKVLKGMESCGFVARDPVTKEYVPGPLLLKSLARINRSHELLRVCAYDEMAKIRTLIGATVGIFIRVGARRVAILESVHEHNGVTISYRGAASPIYTGSSGLVLLSELTNDQVLRILENTHLLPFGPNTVTDRELLLQTLDTIRRQGYVVSSGTVTSRQLITGLAVPIRNYTEPLALSAYGPRDTFDPTIPRCIGLLKDSAKLISLTLSRYFDST